MELPQEEEAAQREREGGGERDSSFSIRSYASHPCVPSAISRVGGGREREREREREGERERARFPIGVPELFSPHLKFIPFVKNRFLMVYRRNVVVQMNEEALDLYCTRAPQNKNKILTRSGADEESGVVYK